MALKKLSIDLCHQSTVWTAIAPLQRENLVQLPHDANAEKAMGSQLSRSEKQLNYQPAQI